MNEFPTSFSSPEDAYFGFFRADNAQNPEAWADVMSYPHVRVSSRSQPTHYDTPQDYAAAADWAPRKATGWVRSQGKEPIRLQESKHKVHFLGGWTRYNASDEPILNNNVAYILTKIEDSWGIQARFGVDSFAEHDSSTTDAEVTALMGEFVSLLGKDDVVAASKLCRNPITVVETGKVTDLAPGTQIEEFLMGNVGRKTVAREVKAVHTGSHGALVTVTVGYSDGGSDESGLVLLGREDENWVIAGLSAIDR